MIYEYDVVVIGSGFGGAITAYKLARKGHKVCILERGPQWTGEYFPGSTKQDSAKNLEAIMDISRLSLMGLPIKEILERVGLREKPLWEYRVFEQMDVLTASGVGGGSLVYANVLQRAHKEAFDEGWPKVERPWPVELEYHYNEVENKIRTNTALCDKSRALKMASEKSGRGKWYQVNLAIQPLHDQVTRAGELACALCHSSEPNQNEACEHEKEEGFCRGCGRCVLGCKRLNKHTLDLNYIRDAVRCHGAHLYPNHEVTKIRRLEDGKYLILCDEQHRSFKAKIVVVAAGSLGSTKLLLRCKDDPESLPNLSSKLGERFSGNGDFQGFAYDCKINGEPLRINSSIGPTITSKVDFNPAKAIVVEEGGTPDVLAPLAQAFIPKLGLLKQLQGPGLVGFIDLMLGKRKLEPKEEDVTKNSLMFLCMGRPGAYGRIELSDAGDVNITWPGDEWNKLKKWTEDLEAELCALTRDGLGGTYFPNPIWRNPLFDIEKLATVHPLGGCPMADAKEKGVVNHNGEVFGYENLYVADGSIIPASLGVNPSLTIGALASRIADLIPAKT